MTAPDNHDLDGYNERRGDDAPSTADRDARAASAEALNQALAAIVDRARAAGSAGLTPDDYDVLARLWIDDRGRCDAILDAAADAAKGCKRRFSRTEVAASVKERAAAMRRAERAPRRVAEEQEPTGLPVVTLGGHDLMERARAAVAALGAHPNVYQRANELVRIQRAPGVPPLADGATEAERKAHERELRREPDAGAPVVQRIPPAVVRMLLSSAAEFHQPDARFKAGARRVDPPAAMAAELSDLGEYDPRAVRPLAAVVNAPVFLPSGRVITAPGYDRATGIYVDWSGPPVEVPDAPTRDDAKAAAERLAAIFSDFRFAGDESEQRASRAAVLASILGPLAVEAVAGPVPGFVFDADRQSAGKSLMAKACGALVLGRLPQCRPWSASEEEVRKTVGALAVAGMPVAMFDNVEGVINSPTLANAMTSEVYSDRVLGASSSLTARWRTTLYFTANGATTRDDMQKRCRFVRLVGRGVLSAGERQGETVRLYKHPDLVAHVIEHRAAYLRDAFTILRGYVLAGRPPAASMEGFEAWSALVGGAVAWAFGADPSLADPHPDANQERSAAHAVAAAWRAALGPSPVTVTELRRRIAAEPRLADLAAALADLCDVPDLARASNRAVGSRLARVVGHAVPAPWGGTVTLAAKKDKNLGVMLYSATSTKPPPSRDDGDDEPDHPADDAPDAPPPPAPAPPSAPPAPPAADPPASAPAPPAAPLPPRWGWSAAARELWRERRALAAEGGSPDPDAVADEHLRAAAARGEVRIHA